MKLSPKLHGILDYVTVAFLFSSPSIFDMQLNAATFTYLLSFVHLLLTMLTNFELGIFRVIPFSIHGIIEIIVSALLAVISFIFFMYGDTVSFYFYLIFTAILFTVWLLSDYSLPYSFKNKRLL